MAIAAGTRLGPYEVLAAVGKGSMSEVYKANDTRLNRTVAIKVLPEHVAADPELRERFEGKAKTFSNPNHLHWLATHQVTRFISTVAFGRRGIPPCRVAHRSNTPGIMKRTTKGNRAPNKENAACAG